VTRTLADERGYLMVALLVAMSVMAILMSVALPTWRTWSQREKEAELIFRGEQYSRAIALFQRKYANSPVPNLDVLINEKLLRKKYKDPITGEDFQLVGVGATLPGEGQQPQNPGGANPGAGRGRGLDLSPSGGRGGQPGQGAAGIQGVGGTGRGGIVGVVSKSTQKAFRLYNGRDTYNQWVFMGVQQSNRAGGAGGLPPGGGGRGIDGRGGRDGGRGLPPLQGPGRGQQTQPPGGGGRGGAQPPPGRGGRGLFGN
jgi:type II secretory pathway pseudopilin PulG